MTQAELALCHMHEYSYLGHKDIFCQRMDQVGLTPIRTISHSLFVQSDLYNNEQNCEIFLTALQAWILVALPVIHR